MWVLEEQHRRALHRHGASRAQQGAPLSVQRFHSRTQEVRGPVHHLPLTFRRSEFHAWPRKRNFQAVSMRLAISLAMTTKINAGTVRTKKSLQESRCIRASWGTER